MNYPFVIRSPFFLLEENYMIDSFTALVLPKSILDGTSCKNKRHESITKLRSVANSKLQEYTVQHVTCMPVNYFVKIIPTHYGTPR